MTLMVFNLSYFIGMSWILMNCIYDELYLGLDPKAMMALDKDNVENYFMSAYGLYERSNKDVAIIATYFA